MYKLTESIPYWLNRIGVRQAELFAARIAHYGINVPMYRVLAGLRESPGQRLNDLARMTTIEISTLSRLVGSMEKMQLVSRSRVENNARAVAIDLTPRGLGLADTLGSMARHFEEVTTAGLSDNNRKLLLKMLREMFERLDTLQQEQQLDSVK